MQPSYIRCTTNVLTYICSIVTGLQKKVGLLIVTVWEHGRRHIFPNNNIMCDDVGIACAMSCSTENIGILGPTMTEAVTALGPTPIKQKILQAVEYARICSFVHNYHGLAIDCEMEMENIQFPNVHRLTLKAILQTELGATLRSTHWRYNAKAKDILELFEDQSQITTKRHDLLLKIAITEGMSPLMLCRALLTEKYQSNKTQISRFMKYPHLIKDSALSANVTQCLCSDNQDGPMTDLRRRLVGEEYEIRLKHLAKSVGMDYYDEQDLRRMGYDKTPDIKMILPFLYRGQVINWIESKANFGDPRSHKYNVQQQLNSYSNRFGAGIVIYWFGFHEHTPRLAENNVGIIVLDDFPAREDLIFLDLRDNDGVDDFMQNRSTGSPAANN